METPESTAVAQSVKKEEKPKHEGRALTTGGIRSLAPQNFAEAEHIAQLLAKSDIVPKEMIGKPANILLAIMFGSEIGLPPAQALQNVMVVNGRPSLWGDAVMGKVEASGLLEAWKDEYLPSEGRGTVRFMVKRKGREAVVRTFSMDDAKKANLEGKAGPWTNYPKRMLFHRARSWALRDVFPDVLKGIRYAEEEQDIIDVTPGKDNVYEMPKAKPAAEEIHGETSYDSPKPEKTGAKKNDAPAAEG